MACSQLVMTLSRLRSKAARFPSFSCCLLTSFPSSWPCFPWNECECSDIFSNLTKLRGNRGDSGAEQCLLWTGNSKLKTSKKNECVSIPKGINNLKSQIRLARLCFVLCFESMLEKNIHVSAYYQMFLM